MSRFALLIVDSDGENHFVRNDPSKVYERPARGVNEDGSYNLPAKRFWKKSHQALFTHWPGEPSQVVDDMLKNERRSGQF